MSRSSKSNSIKSLEEKALSEKKSARMEAESQHEIMLRDRELIKKRLSEARKKNRQLKARAAALSDEASYLAMKEKELSEQLAQEARVMHELVGVVRMDVRDINSLVGRNMQSALFMPDTSFLDDMLQDTRFPGMDDVRHMVALLKAQITETGWVVIRQGKFVDRDGREKEGKLLVIGPFAAAYRFGHETGFLVYSDSSRKFYALSKPLPHGIKGALERYMSGKSDEVPVDISRGAAVRDIVSSPGLWEQVQNGGPVVWPIIAVFIAGLFVIFERTVFLLRRRTDSERIIGAIEEAVSNGQWDQAGEICMKAGKQPIGRVLLAGLGARNLGREEMENALQEAILTEIPSLERFLSALGMLAAISPLLGLLGTVTGMINTFHVITIHGTGDPRLMSAGISEALVTTMLGLSAAIPLLMGHNILGSVVDRRIADMEEKAVSLVNIMLKTREQGGRVESV